MSEKKCFLCGEDIIFRVSRVNPKSGKMEWRKKPFPIHVNNSCSADEKNQDKKAAE